MSRLGREIGRALKALRRAEAKPNFRWNGIDIPCVANEAASSKLFGQGGFAFEADLALYVEASDLPDPGPQEKQTIAYLGRSYSIAKISRLPGNDQVRLACLDPNQK